MSAHRWKPEVDGSWCTVWMPSEKAQVDVAPRIRAKVHGQSTHLRGGEVQIHEGLVGVQVERLVARQLSERAFSTFDSSDHGVHRSRGTIERGRCVVELRRDGVETFHRALE